MIREEPKKAQVKAVVPGYGKVPVVEIITADGESVFIKDSAVVISVLEDCLKSNQATDLQERVPATKIDMHVVGKGSWKDREIGRFYLEKFFPSSYSYNGNR